MGDLRVDPGPPRCRGRSFGRRRRRTDTGRLRPGGGASRSGAADPELEGRAPQRKRPLIRVTFSDPDRGLPVHVRDVDDGCIDAAIESMRTVGCLGGWRVHAAAEGEERIGRLRIVPDGYRLRWVRRSRSHSWEELTPRGRISADSAGQGPPRGLPGAGKGFHSDRRVRGTSGAPGFTGPR